MEDREPGDGPIIPEERRAPPVTSSMAEPQPLAGAKAPASAPPPVGGEPTPEEKFYLDWGLETVKANISRLSELQKNLVTASIALLGGSIVFYGETMTTPFFKWLTTAALIAAAIVSILGAIPEQYGLDLSDPYQIQAAKAAVLETKRKWYQASATLLLAGLCFAALGMAVRYLAHN